MEARIIGFNHDDLADGSGKAGISIALSKGISNSAVNVTESSGYVWRTSNARTLLNSGAVYNALPDELRNVLKTVVKESNNGINDNSIYQTNDVVWLLSSTELGLDYDLEPIYVQYDQGTVYEYYADEDATKRKMTTSDGATMNYPTRSMMCQYSDASVSVVGYSGEGHYSSLTSAQSNCYPRMFGFCI